MQRAAKWIPLLWVLLSADARAWNAVGHQVIGGIADRLLEGTAAQSHVRAILGAESLATASVWADCAKGVNEQAPFHYVSSDLFPECQPFDNPQGREQMVDYVKGNHDRCIVLPGQETCHRQYHYANIDSSVGLYRRGIDGTSDHDIVSGILAAASVLAGRPAPPPFYIPSQAVALRLLVHWVGDLHQPLHIAAVHIDDAGNTLREMAFLPESETRGGNLIRHDGRSLHAEWDEVPEDVATELFVQEAERTAKKMPRTSGSLDTWPATWASESARTSAQVFEGMQFEPRNCTVVNRCSWEGQTPASYSLQRAEIQRKAVLEAGIRLTQILDAIWPE